MNEATPSLFRRYLSRLGSSFFTIVFNLITASLIPRALGASAYGNFDFLLRFFQQITGLFDAGTSSGFFNKLSQRNNDLGLIRTYAKYALSVFLLLSLLIGSIWFFDYKDQVWAGQEWHFIILASLLAYLMWIYELARKVVDAFGCSIRSEVILVITKASSVIAIIILFQYSLLSLFTLFIAELLFHLALVILFGRVSFQYIKKQANTYYSTNQQVITELWEYSSPLILLTIIGVIGILADRWLLQLYGGSEEQGFYAVSFRIAGISLVFTSAVTQLIVREYSINYKEGNLERIRELFKHYSLMLFVLAAYFSVFISFQSDTIVWIFAGDDFSGASYAMMLMAFYPVHQTLGRMTGSFLLGTEKTKLYSNVVISTSIIGLLLSWFLLAPKDSFGLDAGSVGLSVKMILLQFISVNILLWYVLKILKLKFRYFFLHQIIVIILFFLLALLTDLLVGWFAFPKMLEFFIAGIVYTLFSMLLIFNIPLLIGSTKKEFNLFFNKIYSYIKNRI